MAKTAEDIKKLEETLAEQEKAVADAKAALKAAGHSLDAYDNQREKNKNNKAARLAAINHEQSQKLKEMAVDATFINRTSSTDNNNCLLSSLKTNDDFSKFDVDAERKRLYQWYDIIFSEPLPTNIVDQFNNDFRDGSSKLDFAAVKAALAALRTVLVGRGAVQDWGSVTRPADFSKATPAELSALFHDTGTPSRMLNAADALLLAALVKREIILIVSNTGEANHLNPRDLLGSAFIVNGKDAVYIQHNGGLHFQGINKAGKDRYKAIVAKHDFDREGADKETAKEEAALQALEANICDKKDKAFIENFKKYKNGLSKIAEININLESARKRLGSPAPASPVVTPASVPGSAAATPASTPVTPPVAAQILALQKMRDELDAAIRKLPSRASISPNFVAGLKGLHDKRRDLVKALAVAKNGEARKEQLNKLIAKPQYIKVPPTEADRSTSLFYAILVNQAGQKKLLGRMEKGRNQLDSFDISDFVNQASGLAKAKKRVADFPVNVAKYMECKKQRKDLLAKCVAEIEPLNNKEQKKINRIKKRLESDLHALEMKLPPRFRGIKDTDLESIKASIDKDLSVKQKNASLMIKAYEKFKARMEVLRQQQDNDSGDVLNPYDVQWAAIIERHDIVIIKDDGSEVVFFREIFSEEDLDGFEPTLDKDDLSKLSEDFLKQLGVEYRDQNYDPVYVFADQKNVIYNELSDQARPAIEKLNAKEVADIKAAKKAVEKVDEEIATHLRKLNGKVSPLLEAQAKHYSDTLAALADGKPLSVVLPFAPSPVRHTWEAKLERLSSGNIASVTAQENNMRDIHRQNIDVLLALWLQGAESDRAKFIAKYEEVGKPRVINLEAAAYNKPFEDSPMFYAQGIGYTPLVLDATTAKQDERFEALIEYEIKAYINLKKSSSESALVQDYQAILAAIKMGLLVKNKAKDGLTSIPDSPLKPVLDDIHQRVAAKAGHVANMIDHNAYDEKPGYGADAAQRENLRKGILAYRDAVEKKATPTTFDAAKAPQAAHAVKQTTYTPAAGKPSRIVFDIKGLTVAQVEAAFNENIAARNDLLTVKNDKGEDRRVIADLDGGRLKLRLQDAAGNRENLTTGTWARAEAAVKKVIAEIAGENAALTNTEYRTPRKRGP